MLKVGDIIKSRASNRKYHIAEIVLSTDVNFYKLKELVGWYSSSDMITVFEVKRSDVNSG
jgi:hypothetical protein